MSTKTLIIAAALLAVTLSGCSGGGKDDEDQKGGINVRDGGVLDGEAGAINGTVVDDIGIPVAGAFITLDSTFHSTQTSSIGAFYLGNVTPGRYMVRASHPDFVSLQQAIDVEAGRITEVQVVIVLKNAGTGDMRAHQHDYWGTETRINAIDATFEWHEPYDDSGPYAESFGRYYDTATQVEGDPCVWTDSQDEVYYSNRLVWFDEPDTLVYAGTKQIEVVLDWAQEDYSENELMLAWRGAGSPTYTEGTPFAKGATFVIPVDPVDWDSSHQTFSLWEIFLCTPDDGDPHSVPGSISVVMDFVRIDGPIPAERPHPVLWPADGLVTVVAGAEPKEFAAGYALSRSTYNSGFVVRPDPLENGSVLVPPRTKELLAHLEWTTTSPSPHAWSLTYRPANERFWDMRDPGQMLKPSPSAQGASSRDYVIPVDPIQADQFYQSRSNWFFMLNVEGEEGDWKYLDAFAYSVTLTVTAVKDPAA